MARPRGQSTNVSLQIANFMIAKIPSRWHFREAPSLRKTPPSKDMRRFKKEGFFWPLGGKGGNLLRRRRPQRAAKRSLPAFGRADNLFRQAKMAKQKNSP